MIHSCNCEFCTYGAKKEVTYSRKRYIFVCAGCDRLADTTRKDTLTCSPACRVAANRSGNIQRLKQDARRYAITASMILQAAAAWQLMPDAMNDKLGDADFIFDDLNADLQKKFDALVSRAIEAERGVRP